MSILFSDGFDHYLTLTDKWSFTVVGSNFTNGSSATIQTLGRGGASCLVCQATATNIGSAQVVKNIGSQNSRYVGFAFYFDPTGQNQESTILQFYDSVTPQISINITPTGTINARRGDYNGTLLGSAGTAYPSASFHYLEIFTTIGSSTGVVTVRVDGTNVISLTAQNTQSSGNSSFDSIYLGPKGNGGGAGLTTYYGRFDDFYIADTAFLGDYRIAGLLATANGTQNDFTNVDAAWAASTVTNLQTTITDGTNLQRATAITGDFKTGTVTPTWNTTVGGTTTDNHVTWTNIGPVAQYKSVNEGDPDGDSSYLKSNTVNQISRFTFPAIAGSNIATVMVWIYARKDDGGTRSVRGAIKSGAILGDTGTDIALGSNYQYLMAQSTTDPNTGAGWTVTGVNAAEFGVKLTV